MFCLFLMVCAREYIHDFPVGNNEAEQPDTLFILGGYSWRRSSFAIWLLHYDPNIKRFTFRPARQWGGGDGKKVIAFAGDHVSEAKQRLRQILRERNKLPEGGFDMEPFEVLRDMIRTDAYPSIGGPPQVLKVYRHMNTMLYALYWPNSEAGSISVLGRPLLDYEKTTYLVLDPDTLQTTQPYVD